MQEIKGDVVCVHLLMGSQDSLARFLNKQGEESKTMSQVELLGHERLPGLNREKARATFMLTSATKEVDQLQADLKANLEIIEKCLQVPA